MVTKAAKSASKPAVNASSKTAEAAVWPYPVSTPKFMDHLNNKESLVKAFRSIQLEPKIMAALEKLYATKLGVPVTRKANNIVTGETVWHCSKIGKLLTAHYGGQAEGPIHAMMWIGQIEKLNDNSEQWVMRKQVRSAVEALGWF